ncbi:MAG: sulfatase, partial [Planctomycetota bacterium]
MRACRLDFLSGIRSCFASIFLLSCLTAAEAVAKDSAPANVIVILADDLGFGDLACYGHPKFKTPRLDKMAAEGFRFTQFRTPMPFCAPTRASLLTGRYPSRCGMPSNPAPDGGPLTDTIALPLSEILLPELFRKVGYATGMVGKWHLGHRKPESLPTNRGFDEYLGILYSNDMRPVQLIEGEKVVEYPLVQATLTQRYTERALSFIERNQAKPFFLYVAHAMPHKPLACSERFYKKSGAGLYGDVMAELDWSVGEILDKVRELGLDERTLVIFTSDNGAWFGGSTGGLRGMKSTIWEGGYRVPCIARWPGVIPKGNVSGELAVTMDLFATTLAAAKLDLPKDRVIDGKDLLAVMTKGEASPHEFIFGQQGAKLATVRDKRWKLYFEPFRDRWLEIKRPWIDPRGPDGVTILAPYEQYSPSDYPGSRAGVETRAMALYDLENDPAEQQDVAGENP